MYCVLVGFSCDGMRPEAIRQDPTRKGSVVNVNPTNTRPQSDTPEIRKYKKRFNSEILCAALWGRYLTAATVMSSFYFPEGWTGLLEKVLFWTIWGFCKELLTEKLEDFHDAHSCYLLQNHVGACMGLHLFQPLGIGMKD